MQNLLLSLVDIKLRSFGGFDAPEHVARYAVAKVPRGPVFREPWRPDAEDSEVARAGPLQIVSLERR